MNKFLNYALFAGFAIIFSGIVVMGFIARQNGNAFIKTAGQIEATNKILRETDFIDALDDENEKNVRNYLLTGNTVFIEQSGDNETEIYGHLSRLKTLLNDNSKQRGYYDSLEAGMHRKLDMLHVAVALKKEGRPTEANTLFAGENGKVVIEKTDEMISGIGVLQRNYLSAQRKTSEKSVSGLNSIFWIFLVLPLGLLGVALYAIMYSFTLRQKKEDAITQLNTTLERRVEERTKELFDSERKYRNLFENNPMCMWVVEEDTLAYLDVNEAAIKYYGYSREEFLNMTAYDIRPDEQKDYLRKTQGTLPCGSYNARMWKHRLKNGKVIDVEITGHKITFAGKKARIILANDITERRIVEEKLASVNHELTNIFNTVSEGLYSMDATTYRYFHVSKAYEKIYGYPVADFYANTRLWYEVIHPDDKVIVDGNANIIKAGNPVKMEYRIIHQDGSIRWVKASVIPTLNWEGRLIRLDGVVADITEEKQAKELLHKSEANIRAIFENTETGYILLDSNLKICSFNQQAKKIVSKKLFGRLADGAAFLDCVPEEKRQSKFELAQKVLSGANIAYESAVENMDEPTAWYYVQMFKVSEQPGIVSGLAMAITDITQRKLAALEIEALNESLEKRVAQRTAELEDANKELESFSYTVSHDLRAPLRIINGFSKILVNEYGDKIDQHGREYLDIINGNVKQMSQLINDLLNFSRLGKTTISPKPVNMTDMVKAVIEEVKNSNDSCHAEINLHNLDFAKCDGQLVKQVWINLISNAVKYSGKAEKPAIEIGITGTNGSAAYYVKDNGAGFDMQQYNRLFTVFQRLHKPSEFEGSGVGLALAQRVVAKHGGKMWAVGKVNEGATFYFTLPK